MEQGYKQGETRPCTICGQPTTSKFLVCYRPGKCRAENKRQAKAARGGKVAPLRHPCSLCGQPTNSKFPICCRPGKCRTEYMRLFLGAIRGPRRSERPPVHPCSLCGQPTTSKFPVCGRPGKCKIEYIRLLAREVRGVELGPKVQRVPATKEQRNELVRYRRQAQKGIPSVYAVWFPGPQVLKVGFTTDTQNSIFVGVARTRARRRGWGAEGASCIWKQPGDTRTEAWMQATLAFQWLPAFEQKHNRVCEWFRVPGLTEGEIVGVLNEIYGLVPANTITPEGVVAQA